MALVENGKPLAVVTAARDAQGRLPGRARQAADRIADYVERATGVELPRVDPDNVPEGMVEVRVHGTLDGVDDLDEDGFIIDATPELIHIAGQERVPPWGTVYGVQEFLERFVGVRWLMPSTSVEPAVIGEDVPQTETVTVPLGRLTDEPAAFSRRMTGLQNSEQREWAELNRMRNRNSGSVVHNMDQLLPPDKYFDDHPEWYPGGVRPVGHRGWQPCFSEPGTIDAAIDQAIAFFDDNPDEDIISLGPNDGAGYCEADEDHPGYPEDPQINSRGRVDLSDIYFDWVNQVIEGVLAVHPDKSFIALAYTFTADPPSIPVHPRAIVYLTDDRMAWAHPDDQAKGHQRTESWEVAAENIAFYDYLWGGAYQVPRTYLHQMADTYRYGADHGVVAYSTELYPNWGEGPKAWLALKLQWDPYADADALISEWYERAVGTDAAPRLAAYYELWEEIWTERVPNSTWFQARLRPVHRPWLDRLDPSYLDVVTENDLAMSRQWLETAVNLAQTEAQQSRAKAILRSFDYYEAATQYYHAAIATEPPPVPENDNEALALLDAMVDRLEAAGVHYRIWGELEPHPVLTRPDAGPERGGVVRSFGPGAAASLLQWLRGSGGQDGETWTQLTQLTEDPEPSLLRDIARLLRADVEGVPGLLANESFEDGFTDWEQHQSAPPEAQLEVVPEGARTGEHSLLAEGLSSGGVFQGVSLAPGHYGAMFHYRPAPDTEQGELVLAVDFRNGDGSRMKVLRFPPAPLSRVAGDWATVEAAFDAPEEINGQPVDHVRLGVNFVDMVPGDQVHIDDFAVHQLDD